MAIALEANSVYEIQFFGNAYGNGGDIQLAWAMPGGAIGAPLDRMAIGPTDVAGSYTSRSQTEARFSSHGFATGVGYQLQAATLGSIIEEHLLVSTSTAGTAQLQAGQQQNSGTASVLAGNSWAHVWKRE
jgi:hypothetical protein